MGKVGAKISIWTKRRLVIYQESGGAVAAM
jgi:hypothetical protein